MIIIISYRVNFGMDINIIKLYHRFDCENIKLQIEKMLKSFDFFRRIQTQQQLTSTTGGFFTILAFLAAGLLIFLSIQDYYHITYYTFLAVKNDDSEYLPMRIDIIFNQMPCQALQMEFNDQLQYVQRNMQQKLKMYIVSQDNQETLYERKSNDRERERLGLEEGMRNKLQCRMNGIVNVPKTPGTIIFRATGNNGLIQTIDGALADPARLSYKLKLLEFGLGNNTFDFPIAHKSAIVEAYIKDLEGDTANREFVQDFTNNNQKVNYYNHLKIIPVVFNQNNSLVETGEKYRYSLRAGKAPAYQPYQEIKFYTQIEPINIVYKKEDASFYNLAVSLLAIVGGTVATISIANSISHYLFNIR